MCGARACSLYSYKYELRTHEHAHKEFLALAPETSNRGGEGQQVEKLCARFRNFVAFILPVGLEKTKATPAGRITPPEGVKGLVTIAVRAAHAGPRAAAHTTASPAV